MTRGPVFDALADDVFRNEGVPGDTVSVYVPTYHGVLVSWPCVRAEVLHPVILSRGGPDRRDVDVQDLQAMLSSYFYQYCVSGGVGGGCGPPVDDCVRGALLDECGDSSSCR